MKAILKRDWEMLDAENKGKKTIVPAGRYPLERISNPYGHPSPWLVIIGTKIGMAENAWREWQSTGVIDRPGDPNHGEPADCWAEFEILIEE